MKWIRAGVYHQTSGDWTVCKVSIRGRTRYELWRGSQRMGDYETAQEAERDAAKMQRAAK